MVMVMTDTREVKTIDGGRSTAITSLLLRLAQKDTRAESATSPLAAPGLCAFVTYKRERLAAVTLHRAALVLVLEGDKELVMSGRRLRFTAGAAIALPAGWRGEVVNDPDPATGVYRALCLDFPAELILRTHRAHPHWAGRELPLERRIRARLDAVLGAAVHHFAEGLALGDLPMELLEHRAMEVLLALVGQGALPLQPHAGGVRMSEAVGQLVSWDPERNWTAEALATELGLSNATLRRRLAGEGTSLRRVLAAARMTLAETLLRDDALTVREAALATGYASPSRFARRFKAERGVRPASIRPSESN